MLEAGARLSTGRRGVLSAEQLWLAGTRMGQASLYGDRAGGRAGTGDWAGAPGGAPGLAGGQPGLRVGDWADLVEVDGSSARLAGVDAMQWPLTATADDVSATVVGGQLVTKSGSSGLRDVLARLRRETDS